MKKALGAIGTILTTVIGGLLIHYIVTRAQTPSGPLKVDFAVSTAKIRLGDSIKLRWNVTGNPDRVTIDNNIGSVPPQGERIISPSQSTTWTLMAGNGNAEKSEQATVEVLQTLGEIEVTPTSITAGQHAILRWKSNADSATIFSEPDGAAKVVRPTDFQDVSPATTSRYRIEFNGGGGKLTSEATLTVEPLQKPQTTVTLSSSAAVGEATRVQWVGAHATSSHLKCFDQDAEFQVSDSAEIHPQVAGSFECILTATGPGGTDSHSFLVNVGEKPVAVIAPPPPPRPTLHIDRIDGIDELYSKDDVAAIIRSRLEQTLLPSIEGQASAQVLVNFHTNKPRDFQPGKQYQTKSEARIVVWFRTTSNASPRQGYGQFANKSKFFWPHSKYELNPFAAVEKETIDGALTQALRALQQR